MTGFNGGQIPPKFGQLPQRDLGPFMAQVDTFISRLANEVARAEDEHIRSVLRQAYKAGEAKGYSQGLYDGSALGDPDAEPSFDEWLAGFIADRLEKSE